MFVNLCHYSAFDNVLLASLRLFILLTTENYPVSINYRYILYSIDFVEIRYIIGLLKMSD